jgi:hypothetical protein
MIGSEIYTIKGILVATQLLRQRSGSHVPYTCCGIETAHCDNVETINIDQSQGAVILSVKEGKIFISWYE